MNFTHYGFSTWYEAEGNMARVHLPSHQPGEMTPWEQLKEGETPFYWAIQKVRAYFEEHPAEREESLRRERDRAYGECYSNWLSTGRYTRY